MFNPFLPLVRFSRKLAEFSTFRADPANPDIIRKFRNNSAEIRQKILARDVVPNDRDRRRAEIS